MDNSPNISLFLDGTFKVPDSFVCPVLVFDTYGVGLNGGMSVVAPVHYFQESEPGEVLRVGLQDILDCPVDPSFPSFSEGMRNRFVYETDHFKRVILENYGRLYRVSGEEVMMGPIKAQLMIMGAMRISR